MKTVSVSLPARRKKVRIYRLGSDADAKGLFCKPEPEKKAGTTKKPEKIRTHFTHKFVLPHSSGPFEIELDNIAELYFTENEVKQETQNAYDKGFADGQESTSMAYEKELDSMHNWITRIDSIAEELKQSFHREIRSFEETIVPVSMMIAQKILEREISDDSEFILRQVKQALAELDEDEIFRIYIHPDDYKIIEDNKSVLFTEYASSITVIADSDIKPGGCVLQTSAGTVNSRIEKQLESIAQKLNETMRKPELVEESVKESGAHDDEEEDDIS